jgi:alkanesulfonate monooxygenase SsuD/methylene tetrahydromethanopterin reductase-like flavin-dependent oxidoreductase (luciferase family)
MRVGLQMVFQNYEKRVPDAQVFREEAANAILADELGFDEIWPVEHHFADYAFCPDNMQFLSFIAPQTKNIKLGTGAVILPWNDPYRVVEKMIMLDILSDGRAMFGMGRGLSKDEYEPMGISMDEARGRFDEAAEIILEGLETGKLSANGDFWKRGETMVRPAPIGSFKGRSMSVAMSPDSALQAAKLGVGVMMFTQKPAEALLPDLDRYRDAFKEHHGKASPAPRFADFVYCSSDAAEAEEKGFSNIAAYYSQVMQHYDLMGEHFAKMKGYESYGEAAEMLKDIGLEDQVRGYVDQQAYGTPDQILAKLEHRRKVLGPFSLNACFRYSNLTNEDAQASMKLFAKEVLPVVREWDKEHDQAA